MNEAIEEQTKNEKKKSLTIEEQVKKLLEKQAQLEARKQVIAAKAKTKERKKTLHENIIIGAAIRNEMLSNNNLRLNERLIQTFLALRARDVEALAEFLKEAQQRNEVILASQKAVSTQIKQE